MNILSINPGSSTIKFRLFRSSDEAEILSGNEDHNGVGEISAAVQRIIESCKPNAIDAVGFRVVHGGSLFTEPVLIDQAVIDDIKAVSHLAPLHNPLAVAAIDAAQSALPKVPMVAVFDTGFHRTIPDVAALYALPSKLSKDQGIRRYGAHGISHEYVSGKLLALMEKPALGSCVIVCHLGNGASVCAVVDGKSVDTSMGMTPLEGLVMGTRSGDIDPGVLLHLLTAGGMKVDELDDMLNHKSGLLGLSGISADVRKLETAAAFTDSPAETALAVFAYRVRKYIGSYMFAMGGLDAVAFTGGIGEHSAMMRRRICDGLSECGLLIDEAANGNVNNGEAKRIDGTGSRVQMWVVPTDEELQVARDTVLVMKAAGIGAA